MTILRIPLGFHGQQRVHGGLATPAEGHQHGGTPLPRQREATPTPSSRGDAPTPSLRGATPPRHCEARSAVAIHAFARQPQWTASFLAVTAGVRRRPYPVIARRHPTSSLRGAQRRGNPCLHATAAMDHFVPRGDGRGAVTAWTSFLWIGTPEGGRSNRNHLRPDSSFSSIFFCTHFATFL